MVSHLHKGHDVGGVDFVFTFTKYDACVTVRGKPLNGKNISSLQFR